MRRVLFHTITVLVLSVVGCSTPPEVADGPRLRLRVVDTEGRVSRNSFAVISWTIVMGTSELPTYSTLTQSRRATADADGWLILQCDEVQGNSTLGIFAPPGVPTWHQLEPFGESELRDLGDVVLEPGGTAVGTLRDLEGNPLPGVHVQWLPEDDTLYAGPTESFLAVVSDDDGRYRLTGIFIDRDCVLFAAGNGYLLVESAAHRFSAERAVTVDLELELGRVHSGHVVYATGDPAVGAQIFCGEASATADDDGAYTLRGLEKDDDHICITLNGLGVDVDVDSADDLPAIVTLPPHTQIEIHVLDAKNDKPISDCRIRTHIPFLKSHLCHREDGDPTTSRKGIARFKLERGVDHNLQFMADGYGEKRLDIDTKSSESIQLEVRLHPDGSPPDTAR